MLDEVDQMLAMGFIEDVETILKAEEGRQVRLSHPPAPMQRECACACAHVHTHVHAVTLPYACVVDLQVL